MIGVHVLRPADHAELGHALVGGDDYLHPGPARLHQLLPGPRVPGPAWAEDRLVTFGRDRPGQAERGRPRTAPNERRLTPGGVVLHGPAGMVVDPAEHGGAVVLDRLRPHHPHPAHPPHPASTNPPRFFGKPPACNRVLLPWWFIRVGKPCEEAFLRWGSSGH